MYRYLKSISKTKLFKTPCFILFTNGVLLKEVELIDVCKDDEVLIYKTKNEPGITDVAVRVSNIHAVSFGVLGKEPVNKKRWWAL